MGMKNIKINENLLFINNKRYIFISLYYKLCFILKITKNDKHYLKKNKC